MKPTKSSLRIAELEKALGLHEQYLSHAFRSEVTHITKGDVRLSICGESRAHGGIVLEAMRSEHNSPWSVIGVFYWEAYRENVRLYPARHDDKEAQDRHILVDQVTAHVNKIQSAFYAPRVAEAVLSA